MNHPVSVPPVLSTGTEWIIDAAECDPQRLKDLDVLRMVCESVIADLELCVVGEPQWHGFPEPGGVTGLYLLSESHLACHTYPEFSFATFNLYCCRDRATWNWQSQLQSAIGSQDVSVRRVTRGANRLGEGAAQ